MNDSAVCIIITYRGLPLQGEEAPVRVGAPLLVVKFLCFRALRALAKGSILALLRSDLL